MRSSHMFHSNAGVSSAQGANVLQKPDVRDEPADHGQDFRLESYLRDYRALRLRGVKDPAMVFSNPVRDLSSQHA